MFITVAIDNAISSDPGSHGNLSVVAPAQAREQLTAIAKVLTLAHHVGAPVWLRGGWAMDFYLGQITRDHADVDWFALTTDSPRLTAALARHGFEDVTTVAGGQQIDLMRDSAKHGIGLVKLSQVGYPLVASGPFADEPWPVDMSGCPHRSNRERQGARDRTNCPDRDQTDDADVEPAAASTAERPRRHRCYPDQTRNHHNYMKHPFQLRIGGSAIGHFGNGAIAAPAPPP